MFLKTCLHLKQTNAFIRNTSVSHFYLNLRNIRRATSNANSGKLEDGVKRQRDSSTSDNPDRYTNRISLNSFINNKLITGAQYLAKQ